MASGKENIERAVPNPGETGDVTRDYSNGAAYVADIGRAAQPHNRFFSPIAETEATLGHMTWTEAEGVYKVRFHCREVTGTLVLGDEIRFVFDASPVDDTTDTTQAWNWLEPAGPSSDQDTDVEYFPYFVTADDIADLGFTTRWFEFSAPLRRVDISHLGGTAASHDIAATAEVA